MGNRILVPNDTIPLIKTIKNPNLHLSKYAILPTSILIRDIPWLKASPPAHGDFLCCSPLSCLGTGGQECLSCPDRLQYRGQLEGLFYPLGNFICQSRGQQGIHFPPWIFSPDRPGASRGFTYPPPGEIPVSPGAGKIQPTPW